MSRQETPGRFGRRVRSGTTNAVTPSSSCSGRTADPRATSPLRVPPLPTLAFRGSRSSATGRWTRPATPGSPASGPPRPLRHLDCAEAGRRVRTVSGGGRADRPRSHHARARRRPAVVRRQGRLGSAGARAQSRHCRRRVRVRRANLGPTAAGAGSLPRRRERSTPVACATSARTTAPVARRAVRRPSSSGGHDRVD